VKSLSLTNRPKRFAVSIECISCFGETPTIFRPPGEVDLLHELHLPHLCLLAMWRRNSDTPYLRGCVPALPPREECESNGSTGVMQPGPNGLGAVNSFLSSRWTHKKC
jgi:hypothetical protein